MKNKLIIALSACTLITAGMLNQQSYAYSETAYEMSEGSASGDEAAGPVGAAVGGLFGGAVGLVKDTGHAVSGRTTDDRVIIRRYSDDNDIVLTDRDLYTDEEVDRSEESRSETAKGFDEGAAEGEAVAGPVGAVVGGILGGTVGLAEDAGELVTGEKTDEDLVREYDYNNDVERELTISDVE